MLLLLLSILAQRWFLYFFTLMLINIITIVRYVEGLTVVQMGLVSYSAYLKELVSITITQEQLTALIWMMTLMV